jgi:hypothetical protein
VPHDIARNRASNFTWRVQILNLFAVLTFQALSSTGSCSDWQITLSEGNDPGQVIAHDSRLPAARTCSSM